MIISIRFLQLIFRIIFLTPASFSLFVMHSAGWITQFIVKQTKVKTMVSGNVKSVLPQSNADQIADQLIENTSYSLFEILCLPFFSQKHHQIINKLEGIENLQNALKAGKGVILLTMHAGNYEIFPQVLAQNGFKITSILRATDDPIFKIINQSRSSGGVKLINIVGQNMYQEALKVLEKNECIALLADTGALESRHTMVNFLGREVPAATGWSTLAQRSEAQVVPILVKKKGIRNTIRIFSPVKALRENREQAIEQVKETFENFIKENPEQWLMFLNTYETRRMVEGK